MKKYLLVRDVPGQAPFEVATFDAETYQAEFASRGFKPNGRKGGNYLREELRGEPEFDGLCGPMWGGLDGGVPLVRYESWNVYEAMSN